jgi:predicted membrane metal-binding protein
VSAFTPLTWFFWALAVAALIVEVWAFVDAVRRPTAAFPAAGKQTKPLWLIILGVAAAIGLYSAASGSGIGIVVSILPVAAFIAAAIYLTDVRPKVRDIGRGSGGSSHMGPYGPW